VIDNRHSDEQAYVLDVRTCCFGRVGDANGEGDYPDEVTLGDIMLLVDVKFVSGTGQLPVAEADQPGWRAYPHCEDHALGDIMTWRTSWYYRPGEALPECL
jgi:hypothetical protein